MAAVVVGPVVNKLVDLLFEEAKLFKGVHREVESLKDELQSIEGFLKDAEGRSETESRNEGVKVWVKQVRAEAKRVEDLFDKYIHHVTPRRGRSGLSASLHNLVRSIKKPIRRQKLASEIQDIKKSLHEIKERSDRYKFQPTDKAGPSNKKYNRRMQSNFMEEDSLVGINKACKELKTALVDGKSLLVISLVGAGGIGKTTLVRKVYEDEAVKEHFSCRAWITVSQTYDMEKILKDVSNQICVEAESSNNLAQEDSIETLREYLKEKKYVVVFDDVWDEEFWEIAKNAFPENTKGSRVIVTTRNEKIANDADDVRRVRPLTKKMAWELFCKKGFGSRSSGLGCPKELKKLSRKIVKKCQGLPLVITAIACLMAKKEKLVSEWEKVLDYMSSEFETDQKLSAILRILSLSYDDLPPHLKPCFLYFGIFPEDYLISDARLYHLWIAEGFVRSQRDKKPLEDVAKEYLDELVQRNLVKVTRWECRISSKMCKVHDIMREVILPKLEDEGFCQILDRNNKSFRSKYRRLSINGGNESVNCIAKDDTVKSAFVFNADKLTKPFLVSLFKKFRLLRVLELRDSPLDCLPREVGDLFHLKYLGLKGTNLKTLPKSVGRLENLQTLDLYKTFVRWEAPSRSIPKLPFELSNLPNMRYFTYSYNDTRDQDFGDFHGVKMPRNIGTFENLQTLSLVEAVDSKSIKELEKLSYLRVLRIGKLSTELGKALCTSVLKLDRLDRLSLIGKEDEILDLESLPSPPSSLRFLHLVGKLMKMPHWVSQLQNLLELRLFLSDLNEDPLKSICGLPNLQRLFLYRAYEGTRLRFEEGDFNKLKALTLASLTKLEAVEIGRGALSRLKVIEIRESPLKEVPEGIEHMTSLKTLRLVNMAEEFLSKIRPEGGSDYEKVKHILSITLWSRMDGQLKIKRLRECDPLNLCCTNHYPNI